MKERKRRKQELEFAEGFRRINNYRRYLFKLPFQIFSYFLQDKCLKIRKKLPVFNILNITFMSGFSPSCRIFCLLESARQSLLLLYLEMLKSVPYVKLFSLEGKKQIEIDGSIDIGVCIFLKLLSWDWYFRKISQFKNIARPHKPMKMKNSKSLTNIFWFVILTK